MSESEPERIVAIDVFPEGAFRYLDYEAVVCLDILRATTTLVSAVATGRRVFAAVDFPEAAKIAGSLKDPLLAGGDAGPEEVTYELPDSPVAVSGRKDIWRPLVLVSSFGAGPLAAARGSRAVFVASLRNLKATAAWVAARYRTVAVLGSGRSGALGCGDQIAAARLGRELLALGYRAGSNGTAASVSLWGDADVSLVRLGRSAERLVRTGQRADLDFILSHIDDLDIACENRGGELQAAGDDVVHRPASPGSGSGPRIRSVAWQIAELNLLVSPGGGCRA